jgi:two-component sensor histidine kinase
MGPSEPVHVAELGGERIGRAAVPAAIQYFRPHQGRGGFKPTGSLLTILSFAFCVQAAWTLFCFIRVLRGETVVLTNVLLTFTCLVLLAISCLIGVRPGLRGESVIASAPDKGAAAQRARYEECKLLYSVLHDTVLATLNEIARGVECTREVRQRCAAEADLIRNMISRDAVPLRSLAIELALVARHQAALGLRVHLQTAGIPGYLPPEVAAAITGACREALNNVARHSGTGEAWVTAVTEPEGGVRVTIVDRGKGFALESITPGHGLNHSIAARMARVAGTSEVHSAMEEGTTVALRWPK